MDCTVFVASDESAKKTH